MRIAGAIVGLIGVLWALFAIWMWLAIASIAGPPASWLKMWLYWGAVLCGPAFMVGGAVLVIRGGGLPIGSRLVDVGCLLLTATVLYESIIGMQRRPRQAPPHYEVYAVMLGIAAIADIAAYRVRQERKGGGREGGSRTRG